jgi:hypothetical protein
MASQNQTSPFEDRRKPREKNQPVDYGWPMYLIIITVLMLAGFLISRDHWYKSGDKIGYNIGLVGGIMMLTLLLYPIRKRVGFMKNWILLPKWFKWHMIFGILGPALIMFHSTFRIGSINAGVALVCMMLVSGSGIFGRFFYTKVHYGLYGRHASFKQLQDDLDGAGDIGAIFSFAPNIQKRLEKFRDSAMGSTMGGKIQLWKFMTMGIRVKWHSIWLNRALERAMYDDAMEKNWNSRQMRQLDDLFEDNKAFIESYLATVQQVSQFRTYERLFSLWHVFHVPLIYMLVFSAIWHVIAVHMY